MVRALGLAMVVVVVGYGATTLPGARPGAGFDPWLDGVLFTGGQVLAAVVATSLAWRRRYATLWLLIAASLWLRVLGTMVFVLTVSEPDPVPGVATDVLWLAGSGTLAVALLLRIRDRASSLSVLSVMDIVAGAAAITSASLSILYVALVDLAAETSATVTVLYLMQSVTDVLVLMCVVALLAAVGFRPTLSRGLLGLGLVTVVVADIALRYRVGTGSYQAGAWIAALSLVGMAVIVAGFAAPDDPGPPLTRPPGLWLPMVYVLVATGVMVAAAYSDVPAAALPLAVGALLLEVVRGMRTVRLQSEIAERLVSAAEVESWRFQSLAESSSDLIAMVSADGFVDYLNPAGQRVAGATEPDGSLALTDLLTDVGRAGWRTMQEALQGRGWAEGELELGSGSRRVPVAASAFHLRDQEHGTAFDVGVIMRDITERRQAQDQVTSLAADRRELLRRLVLAQEDERTRVAADIHDDSMQVLAALHLRLTLLEEKLEVRDPDLHEDIRQVGRTLENAMERLRHLMFDLDSPARRGALDDALEQAAGHILGKRTTWRLEVQVHLPLSEETRVTVYRIAVEALTNVRRHAAASHVDIDLRLEDKTLVLEVTDDGRGAEEEALRPRPGHLGIAAMHDRARAAGGRLLVSGVDSRGGTRLRVDIPVEGPESAGAENLPDPDPAAEGTSSRWGDPTPVSGPGP